MWHAPAAAAWLDCGGVNFNWWQPAEGTGNSLGSDQAGNTSAAQDFPGHAQEEAPQLALCFSNTCLLKAALRAGSSGLQVSFRGSKETGWLYSTKIAG